jgi:hypothetical protein
MESQYEKLYKTLMNAARDISSFLGNPNPHPVHFSEVSDEEGINRAIDCAASMQKSRTYSGERLGLVNPKIPDFFGMGSLTRGQVVLYKDEHDGKVTIEVPYSLEAIARERARGSLISSHTIVNVPSEYILELVP